MADERKKTVLQLPYDAVFRIEVSLSSQTTSVIVMRTTARLYCLEGAHTARPRAGDAEWKSLAYGAPCIQLVRHGNGNITDAIFTIRIVIAEVESGIALWEGVLDSNSRYGAMQNNFHTFTSSDSTYAIQFVSEEEAVRMLESVQDLLSQHQRQQQQAVQPDRVIFKKPSKPPRRLSKREISSPCNFKHVSGITMQRTSCCEQELRGTIQRKLRSLSLSNLSHNKPAVEEQVLPPESVDRKGSKSVKSFKRKYSKDIVDGIKRSDPQRMSLPSHFRQRERQRLTPTTFIPPTKQINKTLSHSQGDIPNIHSSHTSLQPLAVDLSPGHRPINYQTTPTHHHMPTYPSQSDSGLNHVPYQPVPIPVQEPKGAVQHVAIASSDIIGWTADGKLIIKMPTTTTTTTTTTVAMTQLKGGDTGTAATGLHLTRRASTQLKGGDTGTAATGLHLTRRASTGQFASDYQSQQRRYGDHSDNPSTYNEPHRDTRQRPPPPSNRPLPLTPLDIAMPQSLALRKKTNPPLVANGNKTNYVTTNNTQSVAIGNTEVRTRRTEPVILPSTMNEATPSIHSINDSLDDSLQEVTDQMSRALAQFDDLLGVVQTSL